MTLLSEEAEKQIVDQVTLAAKESIDQILKLNSVPEVMKKGELVDMLNICNNSADKYLIAYFPFIRVGSEKRWIKSEVLRVLKERQEYLN